MGRSPCCAKVGLNRGAWTAVEDKILIEYIKVNGQGKWRNLPKNAGLKRCGKSCRLRWLNYLRPDIKRGNISPEEEELIIRLHKLLGNRWSLIAGRLPGRTDNEIKNYWNTTLAKKTHDQSNPASITRKKPNVQSIKKKKGTSETESQHKHEPPVVQTKASRCTKAHSSPQQPKIEPIDPNNNPKQCVPNVNTNATQQGSDNGVVPFTPSKNDIENSMLDVDSEEVFSSDLLESDFLDLFDEDKLNELSPSSDLPSTFSKEMLEDWDLSDYIQQASNHHYFGSSELEADWLA